MSDSNEKNSDFLNRIPPQSLEAEKAILSSMIIDNEAIAKVLESIDVEDFYSEAHKNIFLGIANLYDKGSAIDLVTLSDYFISQGIVDKIGGVSYLTEITRTIASTANIDYYIKIVKEKAELRKLIFSSLKTIEESYDTKGSVSEIVDRAESRIFEVADRRIKEGLTPIRGSLNKAVDFMEKAFEKKGFVTGVSTGFIDVDKITGGFQPSDLIIIAARPSVGKTALILNIAEAIGVKNGKYAAIFSLEMSKIQLCQRFICSYSRIDSHKARSGQFEKDDFGYITKAVGDLMSAKIFIDDSSQLNVLEMKAKARRMKSQYGALDVIFVDYLQLIQPPTQRRIENRQNEIAAISRSLKQIARELEVPVVAAAQLNRSVENRQDKRPLLSDLRDSGAIEQDADVIMFLHREDYYQKENKDLEGKAELIIAKHRNGPTGIVNLTFIKEYTRFENFAPQEAIPNDL